MIETAGSHGCGSQRRVVSEVAGQRAGRARRLVRLGTRLMQLLDPPFNARVPSPGYIQSYVPDVRENGGQYTHGAVWTALAFAELGDAESAWEALALLDPVSHGVGTTVDGVPVTQGWTALVDDCAAHTVIVEVARGDAPRTSGGVAGRERGYCLMIGGEKAIVKRLAPIFATLAPGAASAERTAGRSGKPSGAEQGFLHCGPHGAGHFVKMVHNGIEYGIMAAYAEGLNILKNANIGKVESAKDAETTPLREPEFYRYEMNLTEIAEVWRRGSVVGSWLLDLTAAALLKDPGLKDYGGRVSDSGEGRWMIEAAIDEGVPASVLSAALYERFGSRGDGDFGNKVLSAMRHSFGGHIELPAGGKS